MLAIQECLREWLQLAKRRFILSRPVEGRLQLDSWEDKQAGQKRSKLKVVGESMQFIGSSRSSNQGPNHAESRTTPAQSITPSQPSHNDLSDDDIPF